jgi:hypothetical protein
MNWDAIGAVAELLVSLTVIITLIYLATQVRQANTNLRVATARDIANTQNSFLRSITRNEQTYLLYRQGMDDRDSLSQEQKGRFDIMLMEAFNDGDVHYHQYKAGALDEEHWQAIEQTLRVIFDSPGGYASWQKWKKISTSSFQAYIDDIYRDR